MVHESLTVANADHLLALMAEGAVFRGCTFDGADLRDMDAAEVELDACSLRETDFSNLACDSLRVVDSNLERARFREAQVREAEIAGSVCTSADFRNTRLNLSRIVDCDLSLCAFAGADLFGAELTRSRLRAVDMTQTKLDARSFDRWD